ncbi:Auxin-responsive protein SAUR20-like protein [Drosera capensis]
MIKKFVIPISYLHHPLFLKLLDRTQGMYGYHIKGPLRVPCFADDFVDLRRRIEKEYRFSALELKI